MLDNPLFYGHRPNIFGDALLAGMKVVVSDQAYVMKHGSRRKEYKSRRPMKAKRIAVRARRIGLKKHLPFRPASRRCEPFKVMKPMAYKTPLGMIVHPAIYAEMQKINLAT